MKTKKQNDKTHLYNNQDKWYQRNKPIMLNQQHNRQIENDITQTKVKQSASEGIIFTILKVYPHKTKQYRPTQDPA